MKPDNYMSFSIVAGFFVGLAFSISKFDEPEIMVLWTIITTMGVYLIVAVSVSLYFWFLDFERSKLKKSKFENNLEFYRTEFDKREKESAKIRNFIRSIESDDEEMVQQNEDSH
ncbi:MULTISPECIES: hypothetical protein [Helicobacter]|uniref:Motility integral membrane protein n=1 Tax=Helicobacter typhlonius TaxID=76936 RepID=A0A099UCU4_9HELI|nr:MULTISPECIES: hypothetical protein [Helicobacter]TLD78152.1 hypothetical protein LS75_007520 [Helicobacter typhlonius]TLD86452.1 hypothetical protein LS67_008205 [Helicobacter sp. MIT 03-1616]CUU39046.1 Motility integral membrane protein [Helicobacter typhlonius]HCD73593.1 hypothetical protein [Helicobacter sp.]